MQNTKKLVEGFVADEIKSEIEDVLVENYKIDMLIDRIMSNEGFKGTTVLQDLISVKHKNEIQVGKLSKLIGKVVV